MNQPSFPPPPARHHRFSMRIFPFVRGISCAAMMSLGVLTAIQAQEAPPSPKFSPTDAPPPAATGATESVPLKKLSLAQLMNIEVTTVSRSDSTVGQSPAAVTVISQEDIRRSGATTFPELFRRVPGMNVARIDGNKWIVSARGFGDRFAGKLLVQIDGRTIYTPVFGGVYWDNVDYPLEDIERIEVLRGPGASVWGANAVNGVINIITKSAKDTQGGMFSAGGGTEERGFGSFHYGGKISDDLYFRVYGKGFNRGEQFSRIGSPNDGWWGASGGLRLDWKAGERDVVMFEAGYFHDVAGRKDLRATTNSLSIVTQMGRTFTNVFLNVEDEVSDGGHVLARWSRTLGPESGWTLQAYWDRVERKLNNIDLFLRWDTFDLDFQHQFPLGDRNKVVWGLGYRYIDANLKSTGIDHGFAVNFPQAHPDSQLFTAFVQDQIILVEDRLTFTLGSKFEQNSHTGFEIQPTARLLWTPTKAQSVWAAASRAVRTPTFLEDATDVSLLPSFSGGTPIFPQIRGNRALESEVLWAYELGYRAQVTPAISTDIALFYNLYDRLVVPRAGALETNSAGTVFRPLNRENGLFAETYGMGLATTWQVADWWRLHGSFAYLKMDFHRTAGLPPSAEAAEGQSPLHQFYLQSSWNLSRDLEFDLIGRYVDRIRGFNPSGAPGVPNSINSYFALDARLAWRPRKNLLLEVVGQNLLDNHHPESGTSSTIRSPVVEIRRGFYGKATWTF